MFQKKSFAILILLLTTLNSFSQYTDVINSSRPGESMSAFSVGKSIFQSEFGISKYKEKHNTLFYEANGYNYNLDLKYGLFVSQLEFDTNFQYQTDTYDFGNSSTNRHKFKKMILGLKYLIYDPYKKEKKLSLYSWKANNSFQWSSLIPAVSLYAGVNFNFSDNPFIRIPEPIFDPKVVLITQNQFSNAQVFTMNFYMDKILHTDPQYGFMLTYTKGFNEKWSAFIETKGFKSDIYSDLIGSCGAAYLINEDLQVDLSISKSWKNTPSLIYGGAGFSWRFDGNYQPEKVKIDKKKKSKKKKGTPKVDEKTPATETPKK